MNQTNRQMQKMNIQTTTEANIRNYATWVVPLIVLAKIVRWTIMKPQLVDMGIGWGFVPKIASSPFQGFGASISFGGGNSTGSTLSVSDNAISFFQLLDLGFTTYQTWEVVLTILFNILIFFCVKNFYERNPYAGWKENSFVYLNVAILNIFCLNLAKEPYQMMFFLLMAVAISVPKTYQAKSIALVVALVVTILYSRKYYGLVLMYFLILNYVIDKLFGKEQATAAGSANKKAVYGKLLLLVVLFGVLHYFFMSYLMTNSADTYDEMMAVNSRDQTAAASEITPLFPNSNPALLAVDYFIKIFRLMIPIELLFKLKVTYLFLLVYQGLLLTFLARTFKQRDKEKNPTRTIAMYLYMAFVLCSAAFEPDFGSWVRHQGVAFPVILLLI